MPPAEAGAAPDFDRHFRRAVWITYIVTMVTAASFHAAKAADDRGAFMRWRHQILDFGRGMNIWDHYIFPNPPIFPICVYPLAVLPPMIGALAWFTLKAALFAVSAWLCFRMVKEKDFDRPLASWVQFLILILTIRPVLSDLHHGNNNLIILALVVGALYAWRNGFDVLAGLSLGLAISFKVTPALFVPYFLYKRSWRAAGATMLGVGLFMVIVPGLILGPQFNGVCLASWWRRIVAPFVVADVGSPQEINQSMVGVLTRLLTVGRLGVDPAKGGTLLDLHIVAWSPVVVTRMIKLLCVGLVALLALFCRPRSDRRDEGRLLGEFALVVLTMLFVSERSWKHHYVTLILPYTYLVYRAIVAPPAPRRVRLALVGALAASALFMATTSSDLGKFLFRPVYPAVAEAADGSNAPRKRAKAIPGHEIAQYYGMFLWGGVVLYGATAWRVVAERRRGRMKEFARSLPAPHIDVASTGQRART